MRKKILKTSVYIAIAGLMVSMCCLDSNTIIPMIVCGVCGFWLVFMSIANGER